MAMILLCEKASQAWLDAFAAFLREHQPWGLPLDVAALDDDPAKREEQLAGVHVLVAGFVGQPCEVGRETLEKAPELRLVQKVGSRISSVDVSAAREARVQVSLLPAPAHVACAEHTLLLLLALVKKLIAAHQRVVRRPFRGSGAQPRAATASDYAYNWAGLEGIGLVAGKTLGLIGMGDIALETARRARAFGMKLVYHDKEPLPAEEEAELGLERRELDEVLREADVVSLHVALTPQTEKLIDAERLALMKPSALLVNTARGGLVDEAALADALSSGRLAGAALDAWAEEPTPKDNPLLKLDHVVATPHVAAGTLSKTALFESVLPNILAALRGASVDGSLTPDIELKPALPLEEPPPEPEAPEEEEEPAPEPEAPEGEEEPADTGETPVPPEGEEERSEEERLRDEDTPPTIELNPPE